MLSRSFVEVPRFTQTACIGIQRPVAELLVETFHLLFVLGGSLSLAGCLCNPPANCDRVLFEQRGETTGPLPPSKGAGHAKQKVPGTPFRRKNQYVRLRFAQVALPLAPKRCCGGP